MRTLSKSESARLIENLPHGAGLRAIERIEWIEGRALSAVAQIKSGSSLHHSLSENGQSVSTVVLLEAIAQAAAIGMIFSLQDLESSRKTGAIVRVRRFNLYAAKLPVGAPFRVQVEWGEIVGSAFQARGQAHLYDDESMEGAAVSENIKFLAEAELTLLEKR